MISAIAVILNFVIFFLAGFLILKSTDVFVKGAVEVSAALTLSKVLVGPTLVSLITTTPEFAVSATSSYVGQTSMAVGDAVGSCICNVGLILAVGCIIRDITVRRDDLKYRIVYLVVALSVAYLFMSSGVVGREDAVAMLALLIIFLVHNYSIVVVKHRRREQKLYELLDEAVSQRRDKASLRKGVISLVFGGVTTVLLAQYGLLGSGLNIATLLNVPPILIGLSLVAVGTSLPDLFVAVVSSRKQHGEIVLGDVIGANILNLLGVLGIAALIRPLPVDTQTLEFNMPVAIFITLIMLALAGRSLQFRRKAGVLLLGVYVTYLIVLFTFVYR
jgi:cation:H+ antiporter